MLPAPLANEYRMSSFRDQPLMLTVLLARGKRIFSARVEGSDGLMDATSNRAGD